MQSEKRTMRLLLVCAIGTLAGSFFFSTLFLSLFFTSADVILCTRLLPLEPFSAPL